MKDLGDAVSAWRHLPLPSGAQSDAAGELQADVALVDHWVFESVWPFVSDGIYSPAVPDVISEATRLLEVATELAESEAASTSSLSSTCTRRFSPTALTEHRDHTHQRGLD